MYDDVIQIELSSKALQKSSKIPNEYWSLKWLRYIWIVFCSQTLYVSFPNHDTPLNAYSTKISKICYTLPSSAQQEEECLILHKTFLVNRITMTFSYNMVQCIMMSWYGDIFPNYCPFHYIDVIMTTMASQITSCAVVYSVVYSGADQRKHQGSASLAFVRRIHRDRWIPRTKGQ